MKKNKYLKKDIVRNRKLSRISWGWFQNGGYKVLDAENKQWEYIFGREEPERLKVNNYRRMHGLPMLRRYKSRKFV